MICFGFLGIFGEKLKKTKLEKSAHIGLLCHIVGCLAAARPRCQNDTPRVRHGVEKLRRGVATVHNEQSLNFCFQTPRIRTPIV